MSVPRALFSLNFTIKSFIARLLPNPAVSCINILAPVLWNSSINSFNFLNFPLPWYNHFPKRISLIGAIPGRIKPTLFLALSNKKFAASLSKWFGSIQPNMDVPPIEVITILFLISRLPIFHGVNKALYFASIVSSKSFFI